LLRQTAPGLCGIPETVSMRMQAAFFVLLWLAFTIVVVTVYVL
jgi:hypothetical protein